jgi:hypothetical protein
VAQEAHADFVAMQIEGGKTMKHGSIHALVLTALAMAAVATGPNVAATTAAGPYFATPSWDQTLPSNTRFIVLSNFGDQAVLDRETGLVWEQSPSTTTFVDWSHATDFCSSQVTKGNRLGWRVPTVSELASLVDPSVPFPGPTVPSGIFSNVQANFYWTATTWNASSGSAWYVDFEEGRALVSDKFTSGLLMWCVRGGQGVNSQ